MSPLLLDEISEITLFAHQLVYTASAAHGIHRGESGPANSSKRSSSD